MIQVAALQCELSQAPTPNARNANVEKITTLVKQAAKQGAKIILPPELFEGPYFCKTERDEFFSWARPYDNNPLLDHFRKLAKELSIVLPISFFERDNHAYYNSIVVIDTDGVDLGLYRKSHIPDGPGYEEKFYFRPGNTGFRIFETKVANIGVGICWDQWYPECARAMSILGAEILFYPTAIGSEPEAPALDTKDLWQRAMIGHAVSNVIPVIASNRIGNEEGQVFYGHSFISNHRGDKVAEMGRQDEGLITAGFDLEQIAQNRASFGFFRDRRPELYDVLLTADGRR